MWIRIDGQTHTSSGQRSHFTSLHLGAEVCSWSERGSSFLCCWIHSTAAKVPWLHWLHWPFTSPPARILKSFVKSDEPLLAVTRQRKYTHWTLAETAWYLARKFKSNQSVLFHCLLFQVKGSEWIALGFLMHMQKQPVGLQLLYYSTGLVLLLLISVVAIAISKLLSNT